MEDENINLHIINHERDNFLKLFHQNDVLLEALGIHEVILFSLVVKKLHLTLIQGRLFEFFTGTIGFIKGIAGHHILQAATVEGLALSRLRKFKIGNYIGLTVDLYLQAFPQI
jgi:hypothetical protein